jgi:DNA-binding transcriptional LysR family regulator
MIVMWPFVPGDGAMDVRMLDLQALRIFKAVVDEGSVTRAAAQLHYVQSNVTTRLRQLEAELDVALFNRIGGKLVITPAGRTLNSYAERLLRLAQEAKRSVAADGVPRGPLAIGSMETTAAARLPRWLAAFSARHPEVELSLETGPTAHLLRRVIECGLDAALAGGPVVHPALDTRLVFDEELVLITRRNHVAVRAPHDVADTMILVFRSGCSYLRRLETWLESGGVVPRRVLEFGTFEGIVGCVAAGMGISLMPRVLVEQRGLRDSVGVHTLPARFARVPTVLVWRKEAERNAAREAFFAVMQTAAAEAAPSAKAFIGDRKCTSRSASPGMAQRNTRQVDSRV